MFGSGYALVIGVGADLPVTVDDATALYKILVDSHRCGYSPEKVTLLTGKEANRANILRALDWIISEVQKDKGATVIVYFSGHGGLAPNYHLVPNGYDSRDISGTAITGADFTARLEAIESKKLVILLDCCHAGGMAEVSHVDFVKSPAPPELDDILMAGSGRVLIASSRKDEVSYTGTPYSVFTQAIREGLCGYGAAEQDGFAYVADVAMYVGRVVPNRTQDRQHPILKFAAADNFILSYYAGGNNAPKPLKDAQSFHLPINSLDADLVAGYTQILKQYQSNLMVVETRMAQFYDQAAIHPDLERMRNGILARISETETKIVEAAKAVGWNVPIVSPTPPTIEDVISRLDEMESALADKLDEVKRNQIEIYQRLGPESQIVIDAILSEVRHQRVEQEAMHNTVRATRQVLQHIQRTGIPLADKAIEQLLNSIYEEVTSDLNFSQQFELSLPVIPFLLEYKIGLGAGVDLSAVWSELRERIKNANTRLEQ